MQVQQQKRMPLGHNYNFGDDMQVSLEHDDVDSEVILRDGHMLLKVNHETCNLLGEYSGD